MIIKSQHAAAFVKDAVVLDLGDLARQADRLRQAAQAQAEQIIQQARDEAAQLTASAEARGFADGRAKGQKQGYEEGFKKGQAEALEKMSGDIAQVQQVWQAASRDFEALRQAMHRDARQAVLQLALRLADKVVHRAIEVDENVIVEQVKQALEHVLRPLDVTVRIHPADRAVMEAALPDILADFAQFSHVRLVDDEVIGRGGCVVTYGQGRIDATIDTQLRRIAELMLPGGTTVADEAERDAARDADDAPQVNGDQPAND